MSVNSAGTAVLFTSAYVYDADGNLKARSRPSPGGGAVWEVSESTWDTGGRLQISGVSPDNSVASANMDLRKSYTSNGIDAGIPGLDVDYMDPATGASATEVVYFGWQSTSQWLATGQGAQAWESVPTRETKSPLSARRVESSVTAWSGHTAGAIPLGWTKEEGNIRSQAVARTPITGLINSVLTTQTRTLRTNGQFRKVINRNGLDVNFTSLDAANITLPYSPWRDPLSDFSWDSIPHWPVRIIDGASGQVTARCLPNSTLYTEKYTYFTGAADYRAGRLRSTTTWTGQTASAAGQAKGVTYYHYDTRGQTLASYGSGTSTVIYGYDSGGRMTTLRTFLTAPYMPATPDSLASINGAISTAYSSPVCELTSWGYCSNLATSLVRYKSYSGQSQAIVYLWLLRGRLTGHTGLEAHRRNQPPADHVSVFRCRETDRHPLRHHRPSVLPARARALHAVCHLHLRPRGPCQQPHRRHGHYGYDLFMGGEFAGILPRRHGVRGRRQWKSVAWRAAPAPHE